MEPKETKTVTVETTVNQDLDKVWEAWTKPEHITKWNFASDDWLCPSAENDLQEGGKFVWRMEAEDGSVGFDFSGVYEKVIPKEEIAYKMDDGRKARILFSEKDHETTVTETFEPENSNPVEMQKGGWQAILDNFKKYTESKG